MGDPPLAPRKALKVNVSSSAHQAAEAQAGVRRGAASGEAVSEEAAAQEKEAEASAIAEAIEGEAGAPEASNVRAVDAGAIEVEMAEARAPGSVEAEAMETEQVLAPPLVQAISSDDFSHGKEAADVEAASTVEQPAPDPAEGSSALVRLRPEPRGWNFPRVFWRNRADPDGEPVFALEDTAEGGRWDTLEQYRQLAVQSLQTAMTIMGQDLPGVTRVSTFLSRAALFSLRAPSQCLTCVFCFASLGARDPIPWEVGVPATREGYLGPAPAPKGSACRRPGAIVGTECGSGGPPSSLC